MIHVARRRQISEREIIHLISFRRAIGGNDPHSAVLEHVALPAFKLRRAGREITAHRRDRRTISMIFLITYVLRPHSPASTGLVRNQIAGPAVWQAVDYRDHYYGNMVAWVASAVRSPYHDHSG